ncbi:hypothetical protein HanPI659440_Chr13g0510741 [Helianthus annuus]|nr:hypothetical protein HanPI659440_Chr13g0510741 [Helianthus annuus]
MERAVNGTKMGGNKLLANLARFAKENEDVEFINQEVGNGNVNVPVNDLHNQGHKICNQAYVSQGGGRKFSDLFSKPNEDAGSDQHKANNPGKVIVVPDDTMAFKDKMGKVLIGRCKDLVTLRNLNGLIAEVRIPGISLSYLGGLSMALKFVNDTACGEFLLDHHRWNNWFLSLDLWNGQSFPLERLAWVRVFGVPVHLLEDEVINSIAGQFGKVVHGAQISEGEENWSFWLVGVLVGDGARIQESVSVRWRHMQFRVWVEEEVGE